MSIAPRHDEPWAYGTMDPWPQGSAGGSDHVDRQLPSSPTRGTSRGSDFFTREISNGPTRRTSSGSDYLRWDRPNPMCWRSYSRVQAFWPTRFQVVRPAGRPAGRTLWNSRFQTWSDPLDVQRVHSWRPQADFWGVWGAEYPSIRGVWGAEPPEWSIEL